MMMKSKKDIGIYIHIPFCESKCSYCDFTSFNKNEKNIQEYMKSLFKEISFYKNTLKNYKASSIFIGGGTPSIIDGNMIKELLKFINSQVEINDECEITIESNPNSLSLEKTHLYKEAGVNRVSIGAQSFNNNILKVIGRVHSSEDIYQAVENVKKSGINNINIDLMLGLPGQNIKDINLSIKEIEKIHINHISYYSLILEENTPLYNKVKKGEIVMPSEDEDRIMYHTMVESLEKLGFNQYEISNFAKAGFQCKHNLNYWDIGEYLGFGLSSHSNIDCERYWNETSLSEYNNRISMNNKPIMGKEQLTKSDRINEYSIMGLRLNKGIDMVKANVKYNIDYFSYYKDEINKNINLGLIELEGSYIKLTAKGRDLANQVEVDFIK